MTITALISKIAPAYKLAGIGVFVVGTAYGGINYIYKQAYDKAQKDSKNIQIERDVKQIKQTTDSIFLAVNTQSKIINSMVLRQDNHTLFIMAMDRSLKDHYKNSKDANEELIKYIESTQVEVKSNYVPDITIRKLPAK